MLKTFSSKSKILYIEEIINRLKETNRGLYTYTEFDKNLKIKLIIYIILLMTISQMAISIYLPSLPGIASSFKTNESLVQLSLTSYILGYGFSQFFYGPLSDQYGRRLIVLIGLCIFIIASVIAICAPNISVFLLARLLQGIGIGCGDTMGRAIMCDCFKEKDFVKAATYIGMAATITPLISPIIGGYIEEWAHWRANFIILLIYGMLNFFVMFYYLPETNLRMQATRNSLKSVFNTYWFILRNRVFLGFFIPGLICFIGEIIYSMISPFLIQEKLGWSPVAYGWLSILTVAGLLLGTLIANRLAHKFNHHQMVLIGLCILVLGAVTMLLLSLIVKMSVMSIVLPMLIFVVGVGIVYPNTNMGALSPFTAIAGSAGALQGGLQMLGAGFLGVGLAHVESGNQFTLAVTLTLLSILGLIAFIGLIKLLDNRPVENVN